MPILRKTNFSKIFFNRRMREWRLFRAERHGRRKDGSAIRRHELGDEVRAPIFLNKLK